MSFASQYKKTVYLVFAGILFLLVDIGGKYLARHTLLKENSAHIFSGTNWEIICNPGIGLGIEIAPVIIVVLSLILFFVLIQIYRNSCDRSSRWCNIAFVAIMTGALSNFGERVFFGCVTDFVPFFGLWTMNIADILISGGLVVVVWHILRK